MITVSFEEGSGFLRVLGTGRWIQADVDAYYIKLTALAAGLRLRGIPIRVLTDITGADIQEREIEIRLRTYAARLYQPGDRQAIVVKNSLVKSHMREVAAKHDVGIFCSHSAAAMWLSAHDQRMIA